MEVDMQLNDIYLEGLENTININNIIKSLRDEIIKLSTIIEEKNKAIEELKKEEKNE